MITDPIPCPHCDQAIKDALEPSCPSCHKALIIGGEYRLVSLLGIGAVSTVYEAQRLSDQREVALKLLKPTLRDDDEIKRSFEESTQVLRELHHAQVPEVFDFISSQEAQTPALVLEALEGKTLHDRLFVEQRKIPAARAEKFFISLLELLAYLQTRTPAILHRNIQPANLMFRTSDDWIPILVDFDHVLAQPEHARIANPEYASPRQLKGEDCAANDLYSLALTTLVLLHSSPPKALKRKPNGELDLPALTQGLSQDVRFVLSKMLDPDPQAQFKDARQALSAIYAKRLARENLRRRSVMTLAAATIALVFALLWLNKDSFITDTSPASSPVVSATASP